ncbi:hypothetical protein C4J81_01550 [Deltaproteobacteria bacterium Smac51]|nr:hypothetical protein C4J81_01550 [Deltaproteobacteria bacterium Smac51]
MQTGFPKLYEDQRAELTPYLNDQSIQTTTHSRPRDLAARADMVKAAAVILILIAAVLISGRAGADESPAYKVVVYSPHYNHNEDASEYNQLFKKDLEKYWNGNVIELRHFRQDFVGFHDQISDEIEALAADPLIRALVIGEGLPGTLTGITSLRAKRPDIFVIVIDPHEDLETTTRVATLTVTLNNAARGYIFPTMANRMGARTLIYFSLPRHQEIPFIARQKRILSAVSRDMGMIMVSDLTAPDPALNTDRESIKKYFEKAVDVYMERYGQEVAFISTSTVHSDILIPIVMQKGGNVLEAIQSSPLLGFPEALGLTPEAKALFGRWHDLLTLEDEKYMELDPRGGFTLWTYPYPHTVVLSMVDIAIAALEDRADIYDLKGVSTALEKYSPGAKWLVSTIMNYKTNTVMPQAVLVLQDTYWLGHGYQGFTRLNIPTKYYRIQ